MFAGIVNVNIVLGYSSTCEYIRFDSHDAAVFVRFGSLAVRHIEIYVNLKSKVVVSIIKLNYRHSAQLAAAGVGGGMGGNWGFFTLARLLQGRGCWSGWRGRLTTQLKSHLKAFLRVSVLARPHDPRSALNTLPSIVPATLLPRPNSLLYKNI